MIYGNWVALHKAFVKHLPVDRPYTKLEAMFSLSVDFDCKNYVSVSGYSKLWSWSRNRVRKFLKDMEIDIIYDEPLSKKQNQKGQMAIQIRDRSGTDQGQIRFVIDKALYRQKDRSGTDQGQIRDRYHDTTIDPNPNPNKNIHAKAFEKWWKNYPERNGRKVGKKKALQMFKKIKKSDWPDLKKATENYCVECNGLPKDAERFLRNDFWKDFINKAGKTEVKQTDQPPPSYSYNAEVMENE